MVDYDSMITEILANEDANLSDYNLTFIEDCAERIDRDIGLTSDEIRRVQSIWNSIAWS